MSPVVSVPRLPPSLQRIKPSRHQRVSIHMYYQNTQYQAYRLSLKIGSQEKLISASRVAFFGRGRSRRMTKSRVNLTSYPDTFETNKNQQVDRKTPERKEVMVSHRQVGGTGRRLWPNKEAHDDAKWKPWLSIRKREKMG